MSKYGYYYFQRISGTVRFLVLCFVFLCSLYFFGFLFRSRQVIEPAIKVVEELNSTSCKNGCCVNVHKSYSLECKEDRKFSIPVSKW